MPAWTQAPSEYFLDIPALTIVPALKEFSIQTELQVALDHVGTTTTTTNPLSGRYTAESALAALLANTGFTYERVDERTYIVKLADTDAADDGRKVPGPQPAPEPNPVEEIVVSALRLRSPTEGLQPSVIFPRKKIEGLGAPALNHLPQFIVHQPYTSPESVLTNGARYAQLRGLGIDTTMVLINGRRAAPTGGNGITGFDLNTIPAIAIDRVEISPEPVSAALGPTAAGGLFNIVLRQDLYDPVVEIGYGAAAGGAAEREVSFGATQVGKFWSATALMNFFERDSLPGAQRERWRDQDFTRFGGRDYRIGANVSSLDSTNLPGLDASYAAIPDGNALTALTREDFQLTAGQRDLQSQYRFRSALAEARRASAIAMVEGRFSGVTLFGEALQANRNTVARFGPSILSQAVMPASNPYNPFGTPVAVDLLLTGLPSQYVEAEAALSRFVAGFRTTNESIWTWEVAAVHSIDEGSARARNVLDQDRTRAALATPDPTSALNVFHDALGGNDELLASLMTESLIEEYSSEETQLVTSLRGSLGAIHMDVGAEFRWETQSLQTETSADELRRLVAAKFVEVRLPLFGEAMQFTFGSRIDTFSDFGQAAHLQYGLAWQLSPSFSLHGSYGTGFRVPTLQELWGPTTLQSVLMFDPRRDELASVAVRAGGNSDLWPTAARSRTASLLVAPTAGLEVLAKYWRITLSDRIVMPNFQRLLDDENRFSNRVVRDAPTDSDIAAGLPGTLLSVDVSTINGGTLDASGVDLDVSQRFTTGYGDFSAGLSLAWIREFSTAEARGMPTFNRVGMADVSGTIPEWRAMAILEWERGFARWSAVVRHVAEYGDVFAGIPNGRVVPAQTLLDLNVRFDLDAVASRAELLSCVTIAFGVENVFDRSPPFAEVGAAERYDVSQGDLRQRFGHIKLAKCFH